MCQGIKFLGTSGEVMASCYLAFSADNLLVQILPQIFLAVFTDVEF